MNIIREDLGNFRAKPRIPSRVIINNRTLTIFESGNYESILISFYLKQLISFKKVDKDCIELKDHSKSITMCVMCSSNLVEGEISKWINDIYDFRDRCGVKKKPTGEDPRITRFVQDLQYQDLIKTLRKSDLKDESKKREDEIRIIKLAQIKAMRVIILILFKSYIEKK
jgi:hypothetical protein